MCNVFTNSQKKEPVSRLSRLGRLASDSFGSVEPSARGRMLDSSSRSEKPEFPDRILEASIRTPLGVFDVTISNGADLDVIVPKNDSSRRNKDGMQVSHKDLRAVKVRQP